MLRTLARLAASLTLVGLLAPTAIAADEHTTGHVDEAVDVVFVDSASVRLLGDDPGPAELVISGLLPTPCHRPVWEVETTPEAVRVWLWSWPGDDPACAAVLEPVELTIPLGDLDAGSSVLLEGESVAWSAEPPPADRVDLTAAGWSFGMCLGYCAADLLLDGERLVLTGVDREREAPLFVNEGWLTEAGRSALAVATSTLDVAALQPLYGCPDCADGGAAYLQLTDVTGGTRVDIEFGTPPDELAAPYELAMTLGEALEACASNEFVTAAADCVPVERDPA